MNVKKVKNLLTTFCVTAAATITASAHERLFTYTYEPETMAKGAWEFENWATWRAYRNSAVGQNNFHRFEFRQSGEYGVTDNYTVELYFNSRQESFTDPATGDRHSGFRWDGFSLENRYQVLNPAEHKVGLTLYLEPRLSDDEFEIEQKIILGQRYKNWKWAVNLTHAAEWSEHWREREGELELTAGVSRLFGKHWGVGLEMRDHTEIPDYSEWENNAFYLGPVVSYRAERWWAALTVMPQIFGVNFTGNIDSDHRFELEGHERLNTRLIFGIEF
jgi:hypothetical protein